MKNVLNILRSVGIALAIIIGVGSTLANSYVIFAPDEWPKPFYLTYRYPIIPPLVEGSEGNETTAGEAPVASAPHASAPQPAAPAAPVSSQAPEPTLAPIEIRPGQGIMIDTGTKIVNLVDPSGRKYLRSTIVLEFAPKDLRYYTMSEEERLAFLETFKADVDTRLPVINDVVISLLGSQSFESVYTAQGKEDLRKAIMDRLNGMLTEYRVIYVYFTEFVVQ